MKKIKGEKGFMLVTAYLLMTVLSVFSLAMLSRNYLFLQTTERNVNRILAFNFAESGVDLAMAQLASSSSYTGTSSYTTLGSKGGYAISVCSTTTPCPAGITAPVDTDVRIISASGYAPNNTSTTRAYESRPVLAYVELDSSLFEYAAFGDTDMDMNGNTTVDSYDSSAGAYGGANVGTEGNIAGDADIGFVGNVVVNGDVSALTVTGEENVTVNGTVSENATPNLNCDPGTTTLASLGKLQLTGNTIYTLAAGTYHYSSLSISGNAQLVTTGAVTIYVDGEVSISGNGVSTASNLPTNLLIIATGDENVDIGGNGDFYGGVYAPDSAVSTSGNGSFFGAIIADDYNSNGNGNLHYDVKMGDVTAPCTSVDMLSWRETNTVAGS